MKDMEKASRFYKAKTGVGSDGFHPKVPLDLTRETRGSGGVLVEGGTEWEVATASLHNNFLLISKNVTNERPMALMPTLTRWCGALRAP